jgi:TRAP-type mannitol/chloroaromatic compound transport system permease small subunit
MQALLAISRLIDRVNTGIGKGATWLVLLMVLVSSGNALARYALNASSNAWLELQWYLFSAVFLLCAAYTLKQDEHIRIDILTGRLSLRARAWLDIVCGIVFLLPPVVLILVLSWPMFLDSYMRNEYSSNAGGLLRWPAKLLIPVGFFMLAAQGVSEIIKRFAFLAGLIPYPSPRVGHQAEPAAEEHAG